MDETYIGGAWKNKRKSQRARGTKRGRGTRKTPVFGILCRGGQVWAQVVPDVKARTLLPLLRRRVRPGSVVCSDTWTSYTGVAAKGGIRHDRLPPYLAEYVWRYNHRRLSVDQQVQHSWARCNTIVILVTRIGLYPKQSRQLCVNSLGMTSTVKKVNGVSGA
ncbi:MAG: hypothetical protein A3C53_00645 [Omnitrophica WOR_2 bacterium RIFCSPHIGHO2_02_FULL_68_15]|nr:MAG: hypothetical protein A3C53_00645 [Omnitrophica WOR_2 bacterium RIFCSPHIGHO2_02_FULL_68_15]